MNIGGLLANKNGGSGEMREIDISTIGVGERIRVDCGDIESLKQNIQSHGLLRECFKTIKVTKPKYGQVKQRHENRQPSFHTG